MKCLRQDCKHPLIQPVQTTLVAACNRIQGGLDEHPDIVEELLDTFASAMTHAGSVVVQFGMLHVLVEVAVAAVKLRERGPVTAASSILAQVIAPPGALEALPGYAEYRARSHSILEAVGQVREQTCSRVVQPRSTHGVRWAPAY